MCDHCRTVVDYNVTINGVVPAFSDFKFLLNQLQHDLKPPGEHDREHIAHISSLLAQQNVQKEEWSQFVHFMENKYTRHLVAHDENFTVLLLCWNRNQRSPIHDHSGSSCWVRVLEGTITERRFMTNGDGNGGLTEIGSADVSAGGVCYINDSQGLHEMANNQADGCVVTLHVYSPPLVSPRVYDTTTGASTTVDFFRAVAPPQEILGLPTFAHPTPSSTPTVALVDFRRLLDQPVVDEAALAKGFDALSTQQSEWSSFITFSDFGLQDVIVHQGSSGYSLQLICALPGQKLHRRYRKTHRRIRVLLGEATLSSRSHSAIVVGPSEFQGTCMAKQPDIFNHSGDYLIALLLTRRVVPQTNRSPLPPRGVTSSQESQQSNDGSSLASTSRMLGTSANSENSILQLAPILTDFLAAHSSPFAALVDELNSVFCRANPISDEEEGDDDRTVHVNELLENTRLEADDLNAYWDAVESNGYRFTLYDGADFVLTLNLWEPGHRSLAHDHDSAVSWVRVIEGALIDTSFDRSSNGALKLVRNSTMSAEDVCFFGRTAIHSLKNKSPVFRAASLHLYVGGGRQAKTYETSRPLNMQSIPGSSRLWHAYEHPFAQDEFAASALPCRPSTDDVHQHSRGASMWDVALPA